MKEENKEITLLVELTEILILFNEIQESSIRLVNRYSGYLNEAEQANIIWNKRKANELENRIIEIISELGGDVKAGELVEKYSEEVSVIIIKKGYK